MARTTHPNVSIHLDDDADRLADTLDQPVVLTRASGPAFAAVRLGPDVTLISTDPTALRVLAAHLEKTADALLNARRDAVSVEVFGTPLEG